MYTALTNYLHTYINIINMAVGDDKLVRFNLTNLGIIGIASKVQLINFCYS